MERTLSQIFEACRPYRRFYYHCDSCFMHEHNICELRRDNFLAEWFVGVGDTEDPPNDNLSFGLQAERDVSNILDVFSQYFLTAEGRYIGTGGE